MTQSGGSIGEYSGQGPIRKWDRFKEERLKDPAIKAAYDEAVIANRTEDDD